MMDWSTTLGNFAGRELMLSITRSGLSGFTSALTIANGNEFRELLIK